MKDRLSMEEKLAAYIEGELSEKERQEIEEQLKGSEEMREALSDLRKTTSLLQNLDQVEPPAWFTQKVMSRVRQEVEQKSGIFQRFFSPFSHIQLPLGAVAAIFLVVVTIFVYRAYQPEQDTIRSIDRQTTDGRPQSEEVWGDIGIIVQPNDMETGYAEVQSAVANLGGIVLRKQSFESKDVIYAVLNTERIDELREEVTQIGEVTQRGELSALKGDLKVKIEIMKK